MSGNIFNESIKSNGPYSKQEIQSIQKKMENISLDEVRMQLNELSTQVENKLKYANIGSLDSKYKKFLNVRENLDLINSLYDKLNANNKLQVDKYQKGSGDRCIAVAQSALLQLNLLSKDVVLGTFDKETLYAVIAFQKTSKNYIGKQDGLIGKQTLAAMQGEIDANNSLDVVKYHIGENTAQLEQIKENIKDIQGIIDDKIETNKDISLIKKDKSIVFINNDQEPRNIEEIVDAKKLQAVESTQVDIRDLTESIKIPIRYQQLDENIIDSGSLPIKDNNKFPLDIVDVSLTKESDHKTIENKQEDAIKEDVKIEDQIQENQLNAISNQDVDHDIESQTPTYFQLRDYTIDYIKNNHSDVYNLSTNLDQLIEEYKKEAILANPSILRYGMVVGAVSGGVSYVGTIIEDPSTKFTKEYLQDHEYPGCKVNTISPDGKIITNFFPLENIVEIMLDEKPVLLPDQEITFNQLESDFDKKQKASWGKAYKQYINGLGR